MRHNAQERNFSLVPVPLDVLHVYLNEIYFLEREMTVVLFESMLFWDNINKYQTFDSHVYD